MRRVRLRRNLRSYIALSDPLATARSETAVRQLTIVIRGDLTTAPETRLPSGLQTAIEKGYAVPALGDLTALSR